MRVSGWPWTFVVLALLTATGCGSATPVAPAPQPTPAPSLTPPPVPEPTPTPAPSPSTAPESCDGCEAPVTNTKPPARLTLRLYTVEDGFGRFISRPDPLDPIPVGWYARIDVTAKDEFDDETNGERPPTFNWTNGFLVDVGGGHSHQRRMKVLGTGSADFWVRQQGVESNRLTLHFGQ